MSTENQRDQLISYFTLRVLIGASGILLPLLLVLGKLIYQCEWLVEDSISDYYDNGTAGDILVGVLFVLGFFLFSYHGFNSTDDLFANLGGIFALGVALFPTTAEGIVHVLHFVFASSLFIVFVIFSVYLFRKSDIPKEQHQREKKLRNRIYLWCGIIMIACIVSIFVSSVFFGEAAVKCNLLFWFESVALITFGISWLTKSEKFYLKDKPAVQT